MEIERRVYYTARAAAQFFRDCVAQKFSPSLLVIAGDFEVCVWRPL